MKAGTTHKMLINFWMSHIGTVLLHSEALHWLARYRRYHYSSILKLWKAATAAQYVGSDDTCGRMRTPKMMSQEVDNLKVIRCYKKKSSGNCFLLWLFFGGWTLLSFGNKFFLFFVVMYELIFLCSLLFFFWGGGFTLPLIFIVHHSCSLYVAWKKKSFSDLPLPGRLL